jgi:hypothetical protein
MYARARSLPLRKAQEHLPKIPQYATPCVIVEVGKTNRQWGIETGCVDCKPDPKVWQQVDSATPFTRLYIPA